MSTVTHLDDCSRLAGWGTCDCGADAPTLGPDLDDPAEEKAYLAHVDAEHADHDCDEVHGEEWAPHDCTEEEVEETSTYPTRSGRITVTGKCVVCGSTRYSYPDSIL